MPSSTAFTRRGFVTATAGAAGAIALSPLLAACGNNAGKGGASTKTGLQAALPNFKPLSGGVTADIPVVTGVNGATTDPGFLNYPTNLVHTVTGAVGSGDSFTGVAPSWNPVPPASNAYYAAVNKALGVTFNAKPANGNTYSTAIPPLIAANKLPDWLHVPGWLDPTFNVAGLCGTKFADLTPFLAGDAVHDYPNLAAIPTGGWQAGVWKNKLYGIPSYTDGEPFAGLLFYRKDLLDAKGITPTVKTAADFKALGQEVNNPRGNLWAFDDTFTYLIQVFKVPLGNFYIEGGKVKTVNDHPQMLELLNFCSGLAKAGLVHPDTLAGVSANNPSRFQAGKVVMEGGGTGAWNDGDAQTGQSANKNYVRMGFPLFSSDGSAPSIGMTSSSGWISYLSSSLSPSQIKECLRIANYFAAPFGSYEYNLIHFGVEGVDYTMGPDGPVRTTEGSNTAANEIYNFFGSSQQSVYNAGYPEVTKAYCAWQADAAKYVYKPAFWNLNISVPDQFSKVAAGTEVSDAQTAVYHGKQPVSYFQDAVATWKRSGGDALIAWYQKNIVDKGLS